MFETMQPLYDKVLVKLLKADETTAGGIYIPEEAQVNNKYQKGEVIAVGIGKIIGEGTLIPLRARPGNIVIFGKYAGVELDDEYRILKEDEIFGIVKGNE